MFGGPVIAVGFTGKSVSAVNETYSEATHQFSDRNRDVLMNVQLTYL